MTSSMTIKGQVTVPKAVRTELGLQPGDKVQFAVTKNGVLLKRKVDLERMKSVIGCAKNALPGISSAQWVEMLRGPVDLPPAARQRLRKKKS